MATVVTARVTRGHIVLITRIGGGVAFLALKICLALGARVYVTSSSDAKIARAVALGATGGVNYTHSAQSVRAPHVATKSTKSGYSLVDVGRSSYSKCCIFCPLLDKIETDTKFDSE